MPLPSRTRLALTTALIVAMPWRRALELVGPAVALRLRAALTWVLLWVAQGLMRPALAQVGLSGAASGP